MSWPPLVVADTGHANGPRLIDYVRFAGTNATAVLVEAGQHWRPETVDTTTASVSGLLWHLGLIDEETNLLLPQPKVAGRFALVTYVAITKRDVQETDHSGGHHLPHPHLGHPQLGPSRRAQTSEN